MVAEHLPHWQGTQCCCTAWAVAHCKLPGFGVRGLWGDCIYRWAEAVQAWRVEAEEVGGWLHFWLQWNWWGGVTQLPAWIIIVTLASWRLKGPIFLPMLLAGWRLGCHPQVHRGCPVWCSEYLCEIMPSGAWKSGISRFIGSQRNNDDDWTIKITAIECTMYWAPSHVFYILYPF